MMYRVLGGIALALGAVFGLITLLVLLPFLSDYNISLLVLAAVFGVIAYVFLAIGWQLTHPPKPRRREVESREEPVAREQAVAEIPAVPTPAEAATPAAATPAAPPGEDKGPAGAIEPGAGFAGFDEAAAEPSKPSTNGESRQAAAPRFKKPGAPVPHHESRR